LEGVGMGRLRWVQHLMAGLRLARDSERNAGSLRFGREDEEATGWNRRLLVLGKQIPRGNDRKKCRSNDNRAGKKSKSSVSGW
jgi:hypothetical protein